MSSYQLQARIDEQALKLNQLISSWKVRMGFDEDEDIRFVGNFEDPGVVLPDTGNLFAMLSESPGARANRQAYEAAGLEKILEQNRRFPAIELSAGYKQLTPDWHGFLVGVAIPLPLLNRNTDAIAQAHALERLEQANLESTLREQNLTVLQMLQSLRTYEEKAEQFPAHLENPEQFLDAMAISYEEGMHSLTDFLNILSLMADSYQTKYSQLQNYYSVATGLEAITGQLFIHP